MSKKPPVVNAILRGVYFKEEPVDLDKGKYENRLELLKVPRLTKERILRVAPEETFSKTYEGYMDADMGSDNYVLVELPFICDAITLLVHAIDLSQIGAHFAIWYYYREFNHNTQLEAIPTIHLTTDENTSFVKNYDVVPFDKFMFLFRADDQPDQFRYKVIFHKQKKTKISDISYDESIFNGIVDTGLSKNVFRDVIETLSPTSHNHNLNDLTEKLHASLASISANQHHAESHVHTHVSTTGRTANDHHDESHVHTGQKITIALNTDQGPNIVENSGRKIIIASGDYIQTAIYIDGDVIDVSEDLVFTMVLRSNVVDASFSIKRYLGAITTTNDDPFTWNIDNGTVDNFDSTVANDVTKKQFTVLGAEYNAGDVVFCAFMHNDVGIIDFYTCTLTYTHK